MALFSWGGKAAAKVDGGSSGPGVAAAEVKAAAPASSGGALGQTHMVHCAVANRPTAPATWFGDRKHSWRDMAERVARMGRALQDLGVQPGDRVAILALNSDRYTEYLFATWWIGAVVVPMNIRWSVAENAYSLNDSGAKVVFVDKAFSAAAPAIQAETQEKLTLIYLDDDAAPEGMLQYETLIDKSDAAEDVCPGGEALAGLYYTGGTTGFPKGVMVPHRALMYNNMVMAKHGELRPDSVHLHAAPMFHMADGAAGGGISMVGGTHAYIPAFTPAGTIDALERYEVTSTILVPTMLGLMVNDPAFDPSRFGKVEYITYGGSPMPEGLMRTLIEKLPHVRFIQGYGQTELAPLVSMLGPDDHMVDGPKAARLRSAGTPVVGTRINIVDEDGKVLPDGEVGEIAALSEGAMLGYWNKPEETAKAFRNGWVHTGDGGYRDEDGFIFIVDRMKDMIVTGGENVFSVEVESVISKMPGVAQVAVVGIPSEKWGEAVHAIVVPAEGAALTEQQVIDFVGPQIANYKRPRSVDFRSEPLPMSGAGKILKRDLRAPYWEGRGKQVS
ncbi:MAG: long-chain fatty acid--CoA ligase [Pseudomonadota bacterium]